MKKKGFTLIELLIVIGILAILAAIIYVAVDPATRLSDSRDARRFSEVNSILNAILKFTVDSGGTLPTGIDTVAATVQVLGTTDDSTAGFCAGVNAPTCPDASGGVTTTDGDCYLDLTSDLVDTYLSAIPFDPDSSLGSAADTQYYINRSGSGRLTLGACNGENQTISVQR